MSSDTVSGDQTQTSFLILKEQQKFHKKSRKQNNSSGDFYTYDISGYLKSGNKNFKIEKISLNLLETFFVVCFQKNRYTRQRQSIIDGADDRTWIISL